MMPSITIILFVNITKKLQNTENKGVQTFGSFLINWGNISPCINHFGFLINSKTSVGKVIEILISKNIGVGSIDIFKNFKFEISNHSIKKN